MDFFSETKMNKITITTDFDVFESIQELPADIQNAWVTALREITLQPDIQARLVSFGFEPLGNTPAQFAEVFKADFPKVAELIKAAGVTAQ